MDLIRWASLISDVKEEAADTICMWFFSLVVATPSRVESGWHDGTVGPTYLASDEGFQSKMHDVLKITKLRGRPRRQHKVGNSYYL